MARKLLLILFVLTVGISVKAQSISVNDPADPETNYTAEELIQNVLISGGLDCVSVTLTDLAENPTGSTNVAERSWGYFKSDGTNFPFEEGIILSTGFAVNAEGPNDGSGSSDGAFTWTGDTDLQTILDNEYGTTIGTNNATSFEFTFVSSLEEISFDFIFASEEYEDNFECSDSFRDGFAFLISGPGIADTSGAPFGGANIASIENSDNVPVSTASIHADYFTCGFEVQNTNFFPLYYVSNWDSAEGGNNNTNEFEYDGRTISLTARANIIPGEIYTIKMVIADRSDSSFDSAVFLRAGSFDIGEVDLGEDILLTSGEANCEGQTIEISAGEPVATADYVWYMDGNVIEGATDNTLDVTTTGTYSVEVYYSESCTAEDSVLIEFFPNPEIELGPDADICPDAPILLDATPFNDDELTNITYAWYFNGTLQAETSSTFEAAEAGTYMVEVTGNECMTSDQIVFSLVDFTVDLGDPISPCGVENFEIVPVITGADPANATYLWSTGAETPTITVSEDGDYWVDVTINGCTETGTANVFFRDIPAVNLGDDFFKCNSDVATLNAAPSNITTAVTYIWYLNGTEITGETGSSIEIVDEGTYMVEVNNNECIGSDSILISNYLIDNCIIPEGLSPNGDNVNDCMDLQFLSDELGIDNLKIYNRHGRLVFEQSGYINQFCGQDQDGNDLPTATYYYVLKLNNSNQVYNQVETGWVYINREN